MRLTSDKRGGVNPSRAGSRPSSETRDSRMIASARNPSDRSRRLTQPAAVATPKSTNANALRSSRYASASFTKCSVAADLLYCRHLVHEQRDQLRVPLRAGPLFQDLDRHAHRTPGSVGPISDHCIERVTNRHDPGKSRDTLSYEAVGVATALEVFMVIPNDRQEIGSRA